MRGLAALLAATSLAASPVWNAPAALPFGELGTLELREADPGQPPLPRPGEDRLGPLALRGVEPTGDGRGWRLTVQPLAPGLAVVPPIDFGDGRRSPELRVQVPRTVPFMAPWMGVGGGQDDRLPRVPFPWAWGSLLLAPLAGVSWLAVRRWRHTGAGRARSRARRTFSHHWPPASLDRSLLDTAHDAGRTLLAAHFGEEARSWGAPELEERRLAAWATWVRSLDAARFGRMEPPYPSLEELLKPLEGPR